MKKFNEADRPRAENGEWTNKGGGLMRKSTDLLNPTNSEADTEKTSEKQLTSGAESGNLRSSLKVKIEGEGYFGLWKGTEIVKIVPFAGRGTNIRLRAAEHFSNKYGREPTEWAHLRGEAQIDYHGQGIRAEVHWFEAPGTGKKRLKLKRWL
jgi:hypothetical protein